MIATAIAWPSTTPESTALITSKIQMARLRGWRGRSAHRVSELTNEWGAEGGVRLTDDRNCRRAVKHHNRKRCTHHIENSKWLRGWRELEPITRTESGQSATHL